MDKYEIAKKLMNCFPNSFINSSGEFIAHHTGEYFNFENCETLLDVQCKVIEWFSRAAYKSEPYNSSHKNKKLHSFMLDGINKFLGTEFTENDMETIYTYLGNAIKHSKTIEFIESGYDMTFFNQFKKQPTFF